MVGSVCSLGQVGLLVDLGKVQAQPLLHAQSGHLQHPAIKQGRPVSSMLCEGPPASAVQLLPGPQCN